MNMIVAILIQAIVFGIALWSSIHIVLRYAIWMGGQDATPCARAARTAAIFWALFFFISYILPRLAYLP